MVLHTSFARAAMRPPSVWLSWVELVPPTVQCSAAFEKVFYSYTQH